MRRRAVITLLGGAAAAWPLAARAQQRERIRRIGVLMNSAADDPVGQTRIAAFLQGLQQLGWSVGRNLQIDTRWAAGDADRIRRYAAELAALAPDVIVATGSATVGPLQRATRSVPIVFVTTVDPVGGGFVESLARPGTKKRLGLLRELAAGATRVAALIDPANATTTQTMVKDVEAAAPALAMQIQIFHAGTIREIDVAFANLARQRFDAVFVGPSPFLNTRRVQLAIAAARHVIPTIFAQRDYVEAGGLMSYGANVADAYRQVGVYTGRILKGEKPADLPVIQSTKFELVINAATARTLGLTIPPSLLAIADEVIE